MSHTGELPAPSGEGVSDTGEVPQPRSVSARPGPVAGSLDGGAPAVETPDGRTPDGDGAPTAAARWTRWIPYLLAIGFSVPYAALTIFRLRRMDLSSPDLIVFEQAIRHYANFEAPIVDIKGPDFHHLGDHFHPLLALLAPFYRLFPHPATLLAAQGVLFGLAIIPVTREATRRLGVPAGTAIGVAYGLAWGIQSAADFDFHEIALAVPIIAFALEALLRERWTACALWTLALLGVKEDLGLTVAAIGGVLFLRRKRLLGLGLAAAGITGLLLVIYVIVPYFNPEGRFVYLEQAEGNSIAPWSLLLQMVDNRTKLWTLTLILGVTAFAAVRSPLVLVIVPTVVWRFHSTNTYYWEIYWHYNAILMPIVFMALLDAIPKLRESRRAWLRTYAAHLPAVVLTIGLTLSAQFPFRTLFDPNTYDEPARGPAAQAASAVIPDGATVASDQSAMLNLLARRTRLFLAGNTGDYRPDYIVLDIKDVTHEPDLFRWTRDIYPQNRYELAHVRDGFVVLRRAEGPSKVDPS